MRFKNRVTVVTGGAIGIGRALAQAFGKEGADVLILEKQKEESAKTVLGIKVDVEINRPPRHHASLFHRPA